MLRGLASRRSVTLVIALGLVAVGGCSRPDDPLEDYRLRVLSLAAANVADIPDFDALKPPQRRDLRLAVPEASVGWSEFFELQRCELGALVGYRNSPLGRTAPASERLKYEAEFLLAAIHCQRELTAHDDDHQELQATLSSLLDGKRAAFDSVVWNAVMAGPEMSRRLSTSAGSVDQLANALTDVRDAVTPLLDPSFQGAVSPQRPGERGWDPDKLDNALQRLAGGGGIGLRPAYWQRAAWLLNDVAAALDAGAARVCRNGSPTPAARNLSGVLSTFFVAGARVKLTADMRTDRAWIDALQRLTEDVGDIQPAAFQRWQQAVYAAPDSAWEQLSAALKRHAQAWQSFHDRCGLQLGGRGGLGA